MTREDMEGAIYDAIPDHAVTGASAERGLREIMDVLGRYFTWGDVDALRDAADRLDYESAQADNEMRSGDAAYHELAARVTRGVADRIAALLPPRTT